MAISLVLAPVNGTSGTSQNFGSTANRVAIAWQENSSSTIVAPTIGGVSMTQAGSTVSYPTTPTQWGSLWYLTAAGGLGTGSLAVSFSGTAEGVQVMCLDGCAQDATVIDATGGASDKASGSCNVTLNTATANCWAVGGHDNNGSNPVPTGVLTTQGSGFAAGMAHSNGTVATGSITGGFTWTGGSKGHMNFAKITPAISPDTPSVTDSTAVSDTPTIELVSNISVTDSSAVSDTPTIEEIDFIAILNPLKQGVHIV